MAVSREPSNRSISPEPSKTPPQGAIAAIGSPIQTRSRVAPFTSTPKKFSHGKPNFEISEAQPPQIEIPASTGATRKKKLNTPQKIKKKRTKKSEYGIDDITYTDHEKKQITNRYGRQAKFFGTKKK